MDEFPRAAHPGAVPHAAARDARDARDAPDAPDSPGSPDAGMLEFADLALDGAPPHAGGRLPIVLLQPDAAAVSRVAKGAFTLGVLSRLTMLQDEWDNIPENLPYDPCDDSKAKNYETLESFLKSEKNRMSVMPVSRGLPVAVAMFESLVRVVSGLPPNTEYSERPIKAMFEAIVNKTLDMGCCTEYDCDIVKQIVLLRSVRGVLGMSKVTPYGKYDSQLYDHMKKKMPQSFASRLEKWGLSLAQLFIDFLRSIGEIAMNYHWSKRVVFDEHFVGGVLRTLPLMTHVLVSPTTVDDILARSSK